MIVQINTARILRLSLLLYLSIGFCMAGEWHVRDKNTLYFQGEILEGEYGRFQSVRGSMDIKVLVVKSRGGDVEEGLKIGRFLANNKLQKIIVQEYCISSCANYLFLSAIEKDISEGVVGFHGSAFALFESENESLNPSAGENSADDAVRVNKRLYVEAVVLDEKSFFIERGVDFDLFRLSQRKDKGQFNGRTYSFWIPSVEIFEKFGVSGVSGNYPLWLTKDSYWRSPVLKR